MTSVSLTVNGRQVSEDVQPRTHLADFLRETQNLTGTHLGCEHGVCGACTILVDGVPTRSCITLAVACEKAEVVTIEGLDDDEIARELRAAFSEEHGLQCGYCTPGVIVSARDVVLRLDAPTEHDIRVAMSGNLCRCTGYVGIVRAIQRIVAARRSRNIKAIPDGGRSRLGPSGSGHAEARVNGIPAALRQADGPLLAAAGPVDGSVVPRRDADWKPQQTLSESFAVAHPVDEVWTFFRYTGAVASCLPGASLSGEAVNGHVNGQIRVKIGPMVAEFRGVANVTRDEATRSGTIDGTGKDRRSNSSTRGRIVYAVRPGDKPAETRVHLDIGFTLTGPLAQFSRAGLVQDVARRIIAMFVQNLEARLSHRSGEAGAPTAVTELNAGSLIGVTVRDYIKLMIGRFFGRR